MLTSFLGAYVVGMGGLLSSCSPWVQPELPLQNLGPDSATGDIPGTFKFAPGEATYSHRAAAEVNQVVVEQTIEADGSRHHMLHTVRRGTELLFERESWRSPGGVVAISMLLGSPLASVRLYSTDGVWLNGTVNGQAIQKIPEPNPNASTVLTGNDIRYANGALVRLPPPDPATQQLIINSLKALKEQTTPEHGIAHQPSPNGVERMDYESSPPAERLASGPPPSSGCAPQTGISACIK